MMTNVNRLARAAAGIAAALNDQARQPECDTTDHYGHRNLGYRHPDMLI